MGNCCNLDTDAATKGNINIPSPDFDTLERSGLSSEQKLRIIVRLQAWARGNQARRKVHQRFGFRTQLLG